MVPPTAAASRSASRPPPLPGAAEAPRVSQPETQQGFLVFRTKPRTSPSPGPARCHPGPSARRSRLGEAGRPPWSKHSHSRSVGSDASASVSTRTKGPPTSDNLHLETVTSDSIVPRSPRAGQTAGPSGGPAGGSLASPQTSGPIKALGGGQRLSHDTDHQRDRTVPGPADSPHLPPRERDRVPPAQTDRWTCLRTSAGPDGLR